MFEILHLYGIPPPIIEAIKSLYTNTTATVVTSDGETSPFEVTAGVLQGDTLAPFLFIVVLDYILRLSLDSMQEKGLEIQPRRSRRHPAVNLTDLDFADDLALTTHLVKDAETLLQSLEKAATQKKSSHHSSCGNHMARLTPENSHIQLLLQGTQDYNNKTFQLQWKIVHCGVVLCRSLPRPPARVQQVFKALETMEKDM
ncbi:hypothetical protein Bbelb_185620 [Branchiostoma belcheri]|nr:hypothetical protein Bbelb_185620 [Branchiostoma belcheri]